MPDGKRDYKPDEKSRSAWELATHLALGGIWFLDSISYQSPVASETGFWQTGAGAAPSPQQGPPN